MRFLADMGVAMRVVEWFAIGIDFRRISCFSLAVMSSLTNLELS